MFSFGCNSDISPIEIELDELTVSQIHQDYKDGKYNSQELILAYTKRIEVYNEQINAISVVNPEAVSVAKKLDEEFKSTGKLRPLHGIPLLVKDNINTETLPTTGGSLALKDFVAGEDAFIIQRLKEAGAIILAKTNMAEWAFSPMHSESSTHGTTRNPYNLDHVPAGSSGGTGAAMAANMGVIGLGTDTGNSIRGPSSHGALVGFRSTLGLVSRSGIIPLYLRNDVAGPMCRTVEDATRVLEVIAGYDPLDPLTKYGEKEASSNYHQYLDANGLQGARIGVLRRVRDEDPDPEIKTLFDQALIDMKQKGAVVIDEVDVPDFDSLKQDQWCADFRKDLEEYLATYVKNDTIKTLEDIIRIGTKSEYTRSRLARNAENKERWDDKDLECMDVYNDVRRIAFREAVENTMDSLQLDAMVYPTWNFKPARIDRFSEEYKGDNNQVISPHTGQPAFTVPMGFTEGNLPAGIQFLGRMYSEPTLIKMAYAYEQATMHRKPPVLK
ncbi:MAG: amidase [Saprospiraceae bacterium]|nr:amidase [Saprospiraceae bacterium]